MAQIFNSLKTLIEPELCRASAALGEKESNVSTAASAILPGLLAKIVKDGNSNTLDSSLKEAGNTNILNNLDRIFSANKNEEEESVIGKFLPAVLGGNTDRFTSAVSAASGVSKESAGKLTNMIGLVIAAFLGRKVKNGEKTSDLVKQLEGEKSQFLSAVPSAIGTALGLSSLNNPGTVKATPKKKSNSWIIWLLLAIALILLIIFGWRSCKNKETVEHVEMRVEEVVEQVRTTADNTVRSLVTIQLPNGTSLEVYNNSVEKKMFDFLNSSEYKNAKSDADLKSKWFEFEDVDFAHDSATELSSGSDVHLRNIAAILKAFPDAKIKIGGNADLSGHTEYNMEISKERAATIKSILGRNGVVANRINTEGFGDENATVPASASDEARAKDRDIAFRFTK